MTNPTRPEATGYDLLGRLDQTFNDLFARNTSYFGGGKPGYYGVRVENLVPDGSELELVLTFRSGVRYCCPELGCHCDFRSVGFWSRLRDGMDARGLVSLPLPRIRTVRVVVEDGAIFDPGGLRVPLSRVGYVYEDGLFSPVIEPDEA